MNNETKLYNFNELDKNIQEKLIEEETSYRFEDNHWGDMYCDLIKTFNKELQENEAVNLYIEAIGIEETDYLGYTGKLSIDYYNEITVDFEEVLENVISGLSDYNHIKGYAKDLLEVLNWASYTLYIENNENELDIYGEFNILDSWLEYEEETFAVDNLPIFLYKELEDFLEDLSIRYIEKTEKKINDFIYKMKERLEVVNNYPYDEKGIIEYLENKGKVYNEEGELII